MTVISACACFERRRLQARDRREVVVVANGGFLRVEAVIQAFAKPGTAASGPMTPMIVGSPSNRTSRPTMDLSAANRVFQKS
jgi:hypothetical protein